MLKFILSFAVLALMFGLAMITLNTKIIKSYWKQIVLTGVVMTMAASSLFVIVQVF